MRLLAKVAATLVVCAALGTGFVKVAQWCNTYTMPANVVEINGDVVTFRVTNGHEYRWIMEDGETFRMGEEVTLRLDFNGTDNNVRDDVIVEVK